MMQWIKKISVLGLALFILSGGVGSAAPKKDDLQDILLYPRVGVLIFMDSGLRGDDKIQDQLRTAVQQKMNKITASIGIGVVAIGAIGGGIWWYRHHV